VKGLEKGSGFIQRVLTDPKAWIAGSEQVLLRLIGVARITARAVEILGSMEKAEVWLREQNPGLGGKCPIDLAGTAPEIRVDRVLSGIAEDLVRDAA
jgi:uncharacterized protein (DUF2384 family)